jgi:sterol desaturase/sphingolipid hydroxylase (fatty acid hydroxylase superfamily)
MDHFFTWIAATYSQGFFGLWASVVLLGVLLHLAERVRPAERDQSYRGMLANGAFTLIFAFLSPVALVGANYLAGSFLASVIARLSGPLFAIDLDGLTNDYPDLVRIALLAPLVLLPLLVYDFFYYWFHRLQHSSTWLWQQHKLHHSDQALNVTTSYRVNWLEDFFKNLLVTIPTGVVLGLQPFQVGLVAAATGVIAHLWGQYLHSNLRLSYGPLTGWVTGPQYHRIHHSIEKPHQDKNFCTYFPVWDIMFGTYYAPAPTNIRRPA